MKKNNERVTRGHGALEGYLARMRAKRADECILERHRSGRILDIGCGTTPFFLMNVEFNEKFGVDPQVSREMYIENITLIKSSNLQTLFSPRFFDVVVMLAVIEHIPVDEVPLLLADIYRVLKTRGRLIMTTPAQGSCVPLAVLSCLGLVSREEIDDHKRYYSQTMMRNLLRDAGFRNDRIGAGTFECGMNNWLYADK